MASSAYQILSDVVEEIVKTKPQTILDVGLGFGKLGFLCREYLEAWANRIYPETWKIKIVGIEVWKPFVERLPWNKIIYNEIKIGDAYEVIDTIPEKFDLIIANDVLEHLEKEKGLLLLDELLKKAVKKVIVNVPIGKGWLGNVVLDDNPYNAHKAVWYLEDLTKIAEKNNCKLRTKTWKGVRGDGILGVFEKQQEVAVKNQIDKKWIIVSYYTEGFYEEVANKYLIPSCKKLNLPYYCVKKKSYKDWTKNTNIKPVFIKEMLQTFPDKDIVFIDADATVERYPALFDEIGNDYDLACHYLDFGRWYNKPDKIGEKKLLSAVLLVRHTPKMYQVLNEWIAGLGSIWEQKVLQMVIERLKPRVYELPLSYCYIESLPNGREPYIKVENPVTVQHQVSRQIRRGKAKP